MPHDVHHGAAVALGEGGLQRLRQPPSRFRTHDHAVEHDLHGLAVEDGGGLALGLRQVHQGLADLDAGEAALQEGGHEGARIRAGLRGEGEADHGARARVVAHELVGHALRRIAPGLAVAAGTVHAADLGEEETEVVVELGGRAHRGARGAHGVLLLEGDGRADVLDPVHVGPVEPLEEHARVGGERLDVAPLTLGEDRVEGEGGLARARDARDDGDAVVGDGQGNVLQVVLPGSLDPEPEGLRHSVRPPEMESLPEHAPSRQPDR